MLMQVTLLSYTLDALSVCATSARTCYSDLPPEEIKLSRTEAVKLLDRVIKSGHHSVLEHASFTFSISGVSRALTHQLVRHRVASYCLSGDTVVYSDRNNRDVKKRTIEEIFNKKPQYRSRMKIRCIDETTNEITSNKIKNIVFSGEKPLFEVKTKDGYRIKSTELHKFYTEYGWKQLKDIKVGDKIYTNGIDAYKDKTWLYKKYNVENLSQDEIAKMCGVSKHTVRAWVKKHNITKEIGSWSIGKIPHNKGKTKNDYEPMKIISEKLIENHNCVPVYGENHHSYKGNNIAISDGYDRTNRMKRSGECMICGVKSKTEIHHIDTNPKNSNEENLIELCTKCHKAEHKKAVVKIVRLSEIESITYTGVEKTFDIEMESPHHNFIANGFVVHNSQQSQRYVNMSTPSFVTPLRCEDSNEAHDCFNNAMDVAWSSYNKLLKMGVPEEDARYVLPNACTTNIVVTMNARELLHFFSLRLCNRSQLEIKELANEMYDLCMDVVPEIFAYAGPPCWTDKCHETKPCGNPPKRE